VSAPPVIGIVDDEADFRRAVTRLLRAHEFETEGFCSGAEFLSTGSNRRFDCLLVDLLMPGMSGLDVLAALYGDPDAPPAIVISGQDDPDLFERARALNAFECHSKPIRQDALLGAITRALQLRHVHS
jgi:FixJ family two-component response regulator